ncbi:MAG: hypothetical protein ABJ045_09170 [Alteripontixanthobacter sp.]
MKQLRAHFPLQLGKPGAGHCWREPEVAARSADIQFPGRPNEKPQAINIHRLYPKDENRSIPSDISHEIASVRLPSNTLGK